MRPQTWVAESQKVYELPNTCKPPPPPRAQEREDLRGEGRREEGEEGWEREGEREKTSPSG